MMVPIEGSIMDRVFIFLGVGVCVSMSCADSKSDCEVAPVSGIMTV
jgi:hypothetical protein